jgi:hypothetical protein
VVVTVVAVRMVQTPVDQIINVVAVGHLFMATTGTMDVISIVPSAPKRAAIRIGRGDLNHMFVYVISMHVVKMSVVEIVDMVAVAHGGVAAVGSVNVWMVAGRPVGGSSHGWPR